MQICKDMKQSNGNESLCYFEIEVIIFDSVWFLSKKNNQTEILKKKPKPVQTGLARFFKFCLVFSLFGSVFFGLGSVFLVLSLYNQNRTVRFFQNFNRFNRFFFTVDFFS